jgi:hypothetical protein
MRPTTRARGEPRSAALLARALIVGVLAVTGACGRERVVHLSNAQPSEAALAQAVVDALAAGDRARLGALALTETEFRKYVWPELPASRPAVGMPVDYVWRDTSIKSRSALAGTIEERRGRRPIVTAVTFARAATDYGSFRVHPETRVALRDERGQIESVRLFGSMIEANGEWKIYSYIVD